MKQYKAYKQVGYDRLRSWTPNPGKRPYFYAIESCGQARTGHGLMEVVRLTQRFEWNDPSRDFALILGAALTGPARTRDPDLWYWQERFWLKAVDAANVEWQRDRCCLFYEVEVADQSPLAEIQLKFEVGDDPQ